MQFTHREVRLADDRFVRVKFATPSDSDDPLVQAVAGGSWQPTDALRWLLLNIEAGDRVLDLGAHIGTFSLLAARLGAQVTAVEASPGNVQLLRLAIEANALSDQLTVVHAAVTSEVGEVSFADQGPYGTIDTERTGHASGWPVITVKGTTIDSLSGAPFDWIKMDIEGAECAAISGGAKTLGLARGLAVESNGYMLGEHGTSVDDLLASLRALGYRAYSAVGQTLSPLAHRAFQPETTLDYVAVTSGQNPPLPVGWEFGKARTRSELLRALVSELHHPVPQHRACALSVAHRAPTWARCSPSLRHAVRGLDDDPDPHVVHARESARKGRA
jgi:FkbM family methyltransferase